MEREENELLVYLRSRVYLHSYKLNGNAIKEGYCFLKAKCID